MYRQLTADPDSKALDRGPAPGELSLVHDLVRTDSYLDRPERMGWWLAEQGLVAGSLALTTQELADVIELRLALRDLLVANHEEQSVDPAILERLNRLADSAPLRARFDATSGAELVPSSGSSGAVGRLLAIVLRAMADGTWLRLKICRESGCRWAFYDHSKNRSGTWCSMSDCGNRAKARTYREKRKRGHDDDNSRDKHNHRSQTSYE